MSNAELAPPKQRTIGIPWKPGQSGNPAGRPRGSRNKLADAFIADLKTVWEEDGIDALRRAAREDAVGFIRVVAGLMPRSLDLNIDATSSATSFAQNFANAVSLLHQQKPQMKLIEHDDDRIEAGR